MSTVWESIKSFISGRSGLAIVAGVPARVIRYRFDDETIAQMQALQWWGWDDEKLKRNGDKFCNPQRLLEESK